MSGGDMRHPPGRGPGIGLELGLSMRQTQNSFFGGRIVASDEKSGVSFPDIIKVGLAYGLHTEAIAGADNMAGTIKKVLDIAGPVLCEVKLVTDYIFSPKLSSERKPDGRIVSKPMEDMHPFLDRAEFAGNMIIPILDESK